ncbi:MAG: hypothetical protein JNM00_04965 [Flavobacteriales bacterium]|nr:hypothetical protein [Flavobacteriales bacterium]
MKKLYFLLPALLIFQGIHAQRVIKNPRNPTLSAGIQVVQPLGQFADTFEGYPAGVSGQFFMPIGFSPFEIGVGMAWNSMGSQNEKIMVGTGVYDLDGDEIVAEGDMRIGSNNYRYTAMTRFRPFAGMIQPYADLVAGVETYSTVTRISIDEQGYETTPTRDVHQRDMGFCAGWAAGLGVEITEGITLNGRFESLRGSEASYVDGNTIVLTDDQQLNYQVRTSATDKYTYTLGVTFRF